MCGLGLKHKCTRSCTYPLKPLIRLPLKELRETAGNEGEDTAKTGKRNQSRSVHELLNQHTAFPDKRKSSGQKASQFLSNVSSYIFELKKTPDAGVWSGYILSDNRN